MEKLKQSRLYYYLCAFFGCLIGLLTFYVQVPVWFDYFTTGSIEFSIHKYNFQCIEECAVMGNIGYSLAGIVFLALGLHALHYLRGSEN
ncbi:hypothetical protein ACMXYW_08575 [Neptuniibacter sp. QD48_55]|uniref:hypothetical protein n=1 Tax=Neptuniibacter sp. QD48_55 TaxID=3398212 RepID=UPI0039F5F123